MTTGEAFALGVVCGLTAAFLLMAAAVFTYRWPGSR